MSVKQKHLLLNAWQCLFIKIKSLNSILILFSRPPPDPQRRSVGNIFPPLSAKLFCHPHKWTHITTLSLCPDQERQQFNLFQFQALDPGGEWESRGETPLWLWRLQPLNISDNSEESLRVKSRLWPFSESDLGGRFSLEWWWWWYRRWLRMQVSWPVTSTSKLDTRLVTSISTDKYITCSIVTRDMYKYKYTCTSCKRIVTCDSISTEKYNMCKYCGLWQVL